MKHKIYCQVCQVSFLHKEPLKQGMPVICTVCGAELQIVSLEPEIEAHRFPRAPEEEIRRRVDAFARLRGYTFNEEKESLIEGLIAKEKSFGDFYCPCRFEHEPEFVCPCAETRMNMVRKTGSCY